MTWAMEKIQQSDLIVLTVRCKIAFQNHKARHKAQSLKADQNKFLPVPLAIFLHLLSLLGSHKI